MNDFSFGRKIKFDTSGNPIINANILPSTTLVYDLGSPNKRWRDIYLSGNTIDLGGTKIQKEIGGGIKIADASGNTLDGKFNNIDISGNATINGIINQVTRLDVSGSILPTRNLVYDLGAPDKRWNDLYLSGNTIDLSGTLLSRHTDGSLMVHDSNSNMVNLRANNIIADGNLTVSGTTTTINSTTVTVQDPIITLGSDITNTKDKGIEFKYGTSKIGFFGYDDSTGNLTFLKDASNNSEVFSGTQGTIEGLAFKSTVASGTAPLTVVSSTLVTNLNADLLDGLNSDKFMRTDISTSTIGDMTITGNVGIGINNPQSKLHILGDVRVLGQPDNQGAPQVGKIYVGGQNNDFDNQYIVFPNPSSSDVGNGMYWWSSDMVIGRFKNTFRLALKETHGGSLGSALKDIIAVNVTDSGGYNYVSSIALNGPTIIDGYRIPVGGIIGGFEGTYLSTNSASRLLIVKNPIYTIDKLTPLGIKSLMNGSAIGANYNANVIYNSWVITGNVLTFHIGFFDGTNTKVAQIVMSNISSGIDIYQSAAYYWASDVLASSSWTTSGGYPPNRLPSTAGSTAYGVIQLQVFI